MIRLASAVLLFACFAALGAQPAPPPPPMLPPGPPPGVLTHQLEALSDEPATHTGFTFDRSMMQIAQGMLQGSGLAPDRAAAAITGITFDTYHYGRPAFYEPGAMATLRHDFDASGWKHLVDAHTTPGESAEPTHGITDLWLHFNGPDINAVTVLTRSSREMTVVQMTGSLRPLDLLHLAGHFGIPRVDPNAVMVPEGSVSRR